MAPTAASHLIVAKAVTLSVCGGGSNIDASQPTSSPSSESDPSGPSSTATAFFDSIFLSGTGGGFFQFGAYIDGSTGRLIATGRTEFYVNSDADMKFKEAGSVIAGPYAQQRYDEVYITAEGALPSNSTPYTDIGSSSKVFQRSPDGCQLRMAGTSAPRSGSGTASLSTRSTRTHLIKQDQSSGHK